MSPNAKFCKSQCRRCPPSISRLPEWRQLEPDEAIAPSSALSPCQARLLRPSDHSRDSSRTNIQLTTRLTVPILLLCCLSSIGLVRCAGAPNERLTSGPSSAPSRQPFSHIITFRQVSHSTENSSSSVQSTISSPTAVVTERSHHRVRRLSIWRNPLTARLRNKLVPVKRTFVATSRDSPNTYLRLSHFVRNRLNSLGASLNDKLRYKGRSVQVEKDDGGNVTTTTTSPSSTDVAKNSTDTVPADRVIGRRNDDSAWANSIETDVEGLNSSSKTVEDSAVSPTLNVIDLDPDRTKIAHNILVVRKTGKPGSEHYAASGHDLPLPPTPAPVLVSSDIKNFGPNRESTSTAAPSTPSTARPSVADDFAMEFVPIKNNHRPSVFMSLAKWKLKNKDKVITSTVRVESSTAASSSSSAPLRDQQVASTRFTVSSPAVSSSSQPAMPSASTSKPTTAKELTIPWHSSTASLRPSSSTVVHILPTSAQWSSTVAKWRPPPTTARPSMTSQSESPGDLTTREQWSTVSALIQDDFWSSFATENPMTTILTTGDSSVTEFDLTVTRPTVDAKESTQSWEQADNGDGAQSTNRWKDTAWSENITSRPLDVTSTDHKSVTASNTTEPVATVEDDNSIELLQEYQHSNTPTTAQAPIEDKGADKVNFYLNNGQQKKQQHHTRPSDDGVVIFKNNHGRPRPRPISRPSQMATTNKYFNTAKPPYVTDFFYPTTISAKKPAITVANIVANRVKQPDEVQSASITVLDPPYVPNSFMQLPLNTTIVHKNILVPMKEGRPKPKYPSNPSTHFPVYPVVAGVSNWQAQTTPFIPPVMTTSSPEILPVGGMSTVDDFKVYTPTPKPTKTIIKDIIITASSSIDRFSTGHSTTTTTTTTKRPSTTSSFIRPPSYPVASQSGYVNAIYAPPMPVFSRPILAADPDGDVLSTGWLRPVRRLVNAMAPQGSASFLSMVRNILYSIMVMLLPPLALMSTLSFL